VACMSWGTSAISRSVRARIHRRYSRGPAPPSPGRTQHADLHGEIKVPFYLPLILSPGLAVGTRKEERSSFGRRGVHLGSLPQASGSKIDESLRNVGGEEHKHLPLSCMTSFAISHLSLSLLCLFLSLVLSWRAARASIGENWPLCSIPLLDGCYKDYTLDDIHAADEKESGLLEWLYMTGPTREELLSRGGAAFGAISPPSRLRQQPPLSPIPLPCHTSAHSILAPVLPPMWPHLVGRHGYAVC